MTADLLTALFEINLAASLAILAVLAARRPVRKRFGAGIAYALWLLPPIAAAASLLPRPSFTAAVPQIPVGPGFEAAIVWIAAPATAVPAPSGWQFPDPAQIAIAVWVAGALLTLCLAALVHAKGVARFGRLTPDPEGGRLWRARNMGMGPALVGVLWPRLVLPSDFEARFEPRERALILAHEQRHLKAGDTRINTLIVLFSCLNWFNPLVHIAAFFARVDQELACDAAVVERFPGERRTYAEALLKTQLAAAPLPLGCYWPGGSSNLLKERLEMLASKTHGRARRLAGAAALTLICATGGAAAWAAGAPEAPALAPAPVPAPAAPIPEAKPQEAPAAQPPQAQTREADPAAAELPATVSLTNAGVGEVIKVAEAKPAVSWGSRPGTPAEIRAAINARDPLAVYEMGGGAQEVLGALGFGANTPDHYVVVDGFLGFQDMQRNGQFGEIGFPAHLATLPPPPGTPTVSVPNLDTAALRAFVSAGSPDAVMLITRSGGQRTVRLPPQR